MRRELFTFFGLLIRSSTYADRSYCYRLRSDVWRHAGRFVRTVVSPAKTTEPIEMPFGMLYRVDPGNRALDGSADAPNGKGHF